jgi:ADP-ribosylglycohydrolase
MPVHWYYNRKLLKEDYGDVVDYLNPRNPHPDSVLYRSSYEAPNEKGEILHDQAQFYGKPGVHYHQFLKAGENTLTIKLCSVLIRSLKEKNGYDPKDYADKYIRFMTTPGTHRDTYIEECHRNFFANYARGLPIRRCGETEKHIGGLPGMAPIIVYYADDPVYAKKAAFEHLSLTHPGEKMISSGKWLIETLLSVINGGALKEVLREGIKRQSFPFYGHPFNKLLKLPDSNVVGKRFSTACYVDDSVPAVIYLALKHHDQPEKCLISNTNLGGDNVHRGAVLGALLGAENGVEAFPERWINGLLEPPDVSIFT